MNKDIIMYIEYLDECMKNFSNNYLLEMKDFVENTPNETYVCYERMLSIVANNFLSKKLEEESKLMFYVSELPIRVSKVSRDKLEDLKKEVNYSKGKQVWENCYVDGYFKLNINDNVKHFFVEYKLENIFLYANLATDFLKYKLYTYNSNIDSIFCYVIFRKQENYPSILNVNNKFCLLSKNITSDDIIDSNVYIFNENCKNVSKKEIDKLPVLFKEMSKFTKYGAELLELRQLDIRELTALEKVLLQVLPKFNSRVIKSKLINDNYYFIKQMWDEVQNVDVSDIFLERYNLNEIDGVTEFLNDGSYYYSVIDSEFSDNDRFNAEVRGIRGSAYTSLNLLALLDYFADVMKLDIVKPNYGKKFIGRGKNKKLFDYQETANNRKKRLQSKYGYEKSNELVITCYSLMYLIVNLYCVFYEIDPVNNSIIDEKDISKLMRVEEEMQEIYDRIAKLLDYKEKIKVKGLKNSTPLKELFSFIYNIFN